MKWSWGLRGSTGNIIALGRLYEVLRWKSGARRFSSREISYDSYLNRMSITPTYKSREANMQP
jgi:hypothetical protein